MMRSRRFVLAAGGAALATPAWAQTSADDMTIGSARASLHLIEYASLTCPHCAEFHASNWETLKTSYIDSGRVRFTFREMMTRPAPAAFIMFQTARAGGADANEYLRRVKILFERQQAILATGNMGGVRDALIAAGAEWGLTEAQVMASIQDPAGVERTRRVAEGATAAGVSHTPSFLFNGVLDDDHAFMTPEGMTRMLEARLAR